MTRAAFLVLLASACQAEAQKPEPPPISGDELAAREARRLAEHLMQRPDLVSCPYHNDTEELISRSFSTFGMATDNSGRTSYEVDVYAVPGSRCRVNAVATVGKYTAVAGFFWNNGAAELPYGPSLE